MCFEWFTKGQHDLESDVQQQLFKEKILKLEPYEITMNGKSSTTEFTHVNLKPQYFHIIAPVGIARLLYICRKPLRLLCRLPQKKMALLAP